ncbi:quinon protein alcohol dehydrogenase-like superfamily [Mycena metata]|uniref:Quinon protein alcohol dehydrogenase-like superfamily n=1 Tax=Mycena metata TaxID=1033252 RepID=A0AAD7ITU9_9AGAR|nr:quinon protein alcohol dehydrogenase-like superfamily [Mycena metata]
MTNSVEFFESWEHTLSSDFQRDGVAAESDFQWVTEANTITLDKGNSTLAVFNDDNTIAGVAVEHEIRLYDVHTSRLIQTLRGHAGTTVSSFAFQPGGRKLAVCFLRHDASSFWHLTALWDLDTRPPPSEHLSDAAEAAAAAAFAILAQHWPEDHLQSAELKEKVLKLVSKTQEAINIRDGLLIRGSIPSRPFSRDGRSLLHLPGGNSVSVLGVDTFTERFQLSGHTDLVTWVETSPDDKLVATCSFDQTVRIWSMETGDTIRVLEGVTNQAWRGAFSPDGHLVAVAEGNRLVHIWCIDTGELIRTLGGFNGWVRTLAFSPDNRHLTAGAGGGTLRVFDVESGECEQHWQIDVKTKPSAEAFLEVHDVQYSARGDLFFTTTDGRLFGYRASENRKWVLVDSKYQGVIFPHAVLSADGSKLVAALGSSVSVWHLA